MSFNKYQQPKVNKLLMTDFKKQYERIPSEYKQNYYFEEFLFNMSDINSMIEISKEENVTDSALTTIFEVKEEDGKITTFLKFQWMDEKHTDKSEMQAVLEKDGTLTFRWVFAFLSGEREYIPSQDDAIYELKMKKGKDDQTIFVEHTITSNKRTPYKCIMSSIFDVEGNELQRIATAKNTSTNETLYYEEFVPLAKIEESTLEKLQERGEQEPIEFLRLFGENASICEAMYHQEIQDIYVGKCITNQTTKYAICWKPDCYENREYQKTIESISRFGAPGNHLCYTLEHDSKPWLVEIREEEYTLLVNSQKEELSSKQKKLQP